MSDIFSQRAGHSAAAPAPSPAASAIGLGLDALSIGFGVTSVLGIAGEFASRLMGASARQDEIRQRLAAIEQKKEYTLSLATAKAAASGISLGSESVDTYLAGLAQQFDTEMLGLRKLGNQSMLADLLGGASGVLGGAGRAMLGFRGVS